MRGFSLLEVLVAVSIVAVGVAAAAQLTVLGARANVRAREVTIAAVLAQQKVEDLSAAVAAGAVPSEGGALDANASGFFEYVDRDGRSLGAGAAPPAGSAFVRRWSMAPLPDADHGVWLLQLLVRDLRETRSEAALPAGRRLPGDARIVSALTGRTD